MRMKQETAITLRKAAAIMLAGGYVKGIRANFSGAHCALGAIDAAVEWSQRGRAVMALSNMLPEVVGPDPYNCRDCDAPRDNHEQRVATWSNNLCDSAEQVACVMRAAAEYVELEE